jgi:hypothetical protein
MEIYLVNDGIKWPLTPDPSGEKAILERPVCDCGDTGVVGSGLQYSSDGRNFEAAGFCAACRKAIGRIIAEPNTIFGAREDDEVLNGRCRVY